MPQLPPGLTRVYRPSSPGRAYDDCQDEWGFTKALPDTLTVDDLLGFSATLIVGPPWIGKTTVSRDLRAALSAGAGRFGPIDVGEFWHVTELGAGSAGQAQLPPWWAKWQESRTDGLWVIDGVDEGEHVRRGTTDTIMRELEALGEHGRCLKVMMLSREVEVPQELPGRLAALYPKSAVVARLMPLTFGEAIRMVGENDIQRVKELIHHNHLRPIGGIPAVLQYLRLVSASRSLGVVDVWKGILLDLLSKAEHTLNQPDAEEQLAAAARIAAVMTFSGQHELLCEGFSLEQTLADYFPLEPLPPTPSRTAARQAVKSPLFTLTGGRCRCIQKNVQEFLTSLALQNLSMPQLRPLITDESGKLDMVHAGVIGWLVHASTIDEVREWITNECGGVPPLPDYHESSLDDATRTLDRLERIAQTSQWGLSLWQERGLARLAAPGLGAELSQRIGDARRPITVRRMLFQVAAAVEAAEVCSTAAMIAMDPEAVPHLRELGASYVARFGSDGLLHSMADFARGVKPDCREIADCVSALILEFVRRGLWPVAEAVCYTPDPMDRVIDSTHVLHHELKRRMSAADACEILRLPDSPLQSLLSGGALAEPERDVRVVGREELLCHALHLILTAERVDADDLQRLQPYALRVPEDRRLMGIWGEFAQGYRTSPRGRRELYEAEITTRVPADRGGDRRWWDDALTHDDVEWLMGEAPRLAALDESIWFDLLRLAESTSLRIRARRLVRQHIPDLLEQYDQTRRKAKARHARMERSHNRRLAKRQPPPVPIDEIVSSALDSPNHTALSRMHTISWVCFADEGVRPTNVVGDWDSLHTSTQGRVASACIAALFECDATPLPEGSTIPAAVLFEAYCFREYVRHWCGEGDVPSALIKRWLPTALVVLVDTRSGQDRGDVLGKCLQSDTALTEQIIAGAVRREATRSEYAHFAGTLPAEFWSGGLHDLLAQIVVDESVAEAGRAALLFGIVWHHTPRAALSLANRLLGDRAVDYVNSPLTRAALEVMLVEDPHKAWPHVDRAYREHGLAALKALPVLYDRNRGSGGRLRQWPPDLLLELARMLFEQYPPAEDPPLKSGWVTTDHECRETRNRIKSWLFDRRDDEQCHHALTELANEVEAVGEWYRYQMAHLEAQRVLQGALPVSELLAALDNQSYRIIRNGGDLLLVLQEELSRMGNDVAEDLTLLYGRDGERLHEEALQAYVSRRLNDRLAGRVLRSGAHAVAEPPKDITREPQVQYRRRYDIRVTAPACRPGYTATVVIEVKWSDNTEGIQDALPGQLGNDYLIDGNLSQGVLLIGWNRTPRTWSPSTEKPSTPEELRQFLNDQAAAFNAAHPEVDVRPLVYDLRWPQGSQPGGVGIRRRGGRRRKAVVDSDST